MTLLAIDPGVSGGIAWSHGNGAFAEAVPMPGTERQIALLLNRITEGVGWHAYIEDLPLGMGFKVNPSAMAKLHGNAGFVRGVLAAGNVHEVRPQVWQSGLGLKNTDKLPYDAWKRYLKAKAQELHPEHKVTLKTADALLILEYARRQYL